MRRCTPAQCRRRRHRWNDRTEGGKINRRQITIVWRRMTIDDYLPTMMIILLLLGIIIVFVAWLMPCSVGTFIWMLCFKKKKPSLNIIHFYTMHQQYLITWFPKSDKTERKYTCGDNQTKTTLFLTAYFHTRLPPVWPATTTTIKRKLSWWKIQRLRILERVDSPIYTFSLFSNSQSANFESEPIHFREDKNKSYNTYEG